jgi:hypothetical protein
MSSSLPPLTQLTSFTLVQKSVLSNPEHFRTESSNNHLLAALARAKSGEIDAKGLLFPSEFADVLDIAEGHVRALTTPEAAGQRFALRSGFITWQDARESPYPFVQLADSENAVSFVQLISPMLSPLLG